ncbi:chemotaxis protein [Duganella sp. Leaf126]|uniref:methyl-accepting chemotaxis protein n=1 Tax=Duganella sp. Leaf126 TaxID=1736266 RepID=UPI0006F9233C|nr:methyl-accepting chemotaxis protein [Duganella sp. Leaf126]KQQ45266.1 chemotaxis protein [Duganella sp. Leaf126]
MKISNLNISTRLAAGFGIVLLLLVLVGAMAITRIQKINSATDTILEDRYVKVNLIRNVQDEVNVQARYIRNATIGASDPSEVSSSLAKLEDSIQKNTKMLEQFKGMINSDAGRRQFDALIESRAGYGRARDTAAKLLREGKAEEAGKYVLKDLRPPQNKFFDELKAMVALQEKMMQEAADEARDHGHAAIVFTLVLSGIAAIAALIIGWLITRSITVPVNRAVDLARTVAAGDLTSRITVDSKDEIGKLLASLSEMNDSLKSIVTEVRYGTEEIATATTEVANGNMDLSSRTEEQASALEETASSMEELTSTVKQNSDNARQANQLARSAAEVAVRGGDVVSQVVQTMESINTSASKIVDIISVIDGIAFQTNILALNAAVEAARAGEQGRGFAVVASEVRNLAQRSASAAKEIKVLIGDSVEKVEAGNKLVSSAGVTMDEVVASVQKLTGVVGEITAASHEQEVGIEQINEAITAMDTVTQQNAALVEEAAAATSALQEQAGKLAQVVSVFKLDGMAAPSPTAASAARQTPAPQLARPAPALKPSVKPSIKPVLDAAPRRPAAAATSASKVAEGEWEEF